MIDRFSLLVGRATLNRWWARRAHARAKSTNNALRVGAEPQKGLTTSVGEPVKTLRLRSKFHYGMSKNRPNATYESRDVRVETCRVPNMNQNDILYKLLWRGIMSCVQDLAQPTIATRRSGEYMKRRFNPICPLWARTLSFGRLLCTLLIL
ncbi:hypothetical protein QTP88_024203 [Uroleucon formosanum]